MWINFPKTFSVCTLGITGDDPITPENIKDIKDVVRQLDIIFSDLKTDPVISQSPTIREISLGAAGLVVGVLGMIGYILLSSKETTETAHPATKISTKTHEKGSRTSKASQNLRSRTSSNDPE
jgi:hypothetical protein